MISGFILPRLFLQYYGSEINGLISSITQFLSFIVLLELGIGSVVQSALYKPLVKRDIKEISKIVRSAQTFFNKIVLYFLLYLSLLILIYPYFNDEFGWVFTVSLIVIIAVSSIAQYYFGITYQLLLFADQKSYVPQFISLIILILYNIISILLIVNGASIQIVKLAATIVFLIKPLALTTYTKRNYKIIKNIEITEEPIKQKWNGIAQHIAYFVVGNTDIILLTVFSNLTNVSIYAIYNLVLTGIKQFISALISGVQSLFGNMLANSEYLALQQRFMQFEWMMHTIVTLIYSCTAMLIVPFVNVYTKGIIDADYNQPLFGLLFTCSVAVYSLRLPYNILVLAAGHYKQTQTSSIIEMSINIVFSAVLVSKYGLIGVAIGTLIAMSYRTIYLAHYLSHNIIEYKFSCFIKHIIVDILIVTFIFLLSSNFTMSDTSYLSWLILAVKVFFSAIFISGIVNMLFNRIYVLSTLKGINK